MGHYLSGLQVHPYWIVDDYLSKIFKKSYEDFNILKLYIVIIYFKI